MPSQMRHETIKLGLRDVGSSLSDVAKELNLRRSTVTTVSQGHRRSHRVQKALAAKLGMQPEELFPERYGSEVS